MPYVRPSRFGQTAQSRADSIPLGQCHVVEIQRTHCRPSVVNPRMVRVAGTTMISFSRSLTSLRVRIRTGRRLSGSRNVYQRISPRFNRNPPSPQRPRQAAVRLRRTRRAKEVWNGKRMRRRLVASRSTSAVALVLEGAGSRPREGYHQPSKLWASLEF